VKSALWDKNVTQIDTFLPNATVSMLLIGMILSTIVHDGAIDSCHNNCPELEYCICEQKMVCLVYAAFGNIYKLDLLVYIILKYCVGNRGAFRSAILL
jgi:hypothetical protein